jgi:hypothetical protein
MKCRNCGTEIADKALVCYRCGTATAEPRIPPPPEPQARGPLPSVLAVLVTAAAAGVMVPPLPDGPPEIAGWVGAAVAAGAAAWTLRPKTSPRGRWRR